MSGISSIEDAEKIHRIRSRSSWNKVSCENREKKSIRRRALVNPEKPDKESKFPSK